MKKYKFLLLALFLGFFITMPPAHAIKLKILGKGGIVIYPDGHQKVCPSFSFKVCYEIEFTIGDVIDILFGINSNPGSGGGTQTSFDVNDYLPLDATVTIYEDSGTVTRRAQIIWINSSSIQGTDNGDLTLPSDAVELNLL